METLRFTALVMIAVATAPVASVAEVHMLAWAGGGADDTCVADTEKIVEWWDTYRAKSPEYTIVWHYTELQDRWKAVMETGTDPLTGEHINVLYVPGGWHPERYWHFNWIKDLYHAQIDLGIGYVGICAGAYLHAGDLEYAPGNPGSQDVFVDGVTVIDGMEGPDRICHVLILPHNPLTPPYTWNKVYWYKYWNGPGFGPENGDMYDAKDGYWYKITDIEGKEVMIKIWPVGQYEDVCSGWAIVAGQYFVREGNKWVPRGRFVLFGPHPELTDRKGAHALLAKAILWAAGVNIQPLLSAEENEEESKKNTSTGHAGEVPNVPPAPPVVPKPNVQVGIPSIHVDVVTPAVIATLLTLILPENIKAGLVAGDPLNPVFDVVANLLQKIGIPVTGTDLAFGTAMTVFLTVAEALWDVLNAI